MREEISSLLTRKAELEVELEGLEAELTEMATAVRSKYVADVLQGAEDIGYSAAEFVADLAARTGVDLGRKKRNAKKQRRRWYTFSDGRIYKGGKHPHWLKDRVIAAGVDIYDVAALRKYCEQNAEVSCLR